MARELACTASPHERDLLKYMHTCIGGELQHTWRPRVLRKPLRLGGTSTEERDVLRVARIWLYAESRSWLSSASSLAARSSSERSCTCTGNAQRQARAMKRCYLGGNGCARIRESSQPCCQPAACSARNIGRADSASAVLAAVTGTDRWPISRPVAAEARSGLMASDASVSAVHGQAWPVPVHVPRASSSQRHAVVHLQGGRGGLQLLDGALSLSAGSAFTLRCTGTQLGCVLAELRLHLARCLAQPGHLQAAQAQAAEACCVCTHRCSATGSRKGQHCPAL